MMPTFLLLFIITNGKTSPFGKNKGLFCSRELFSFLENKKLVWDRGVFLFFVFFVLSRTIFFLTIKKNIFVFFYF